MFFKLMDFTLWERINHVYIYNVFARFLFSHSGHASELWTILVIANIFKVFLFLVPKVQMMTLNEKITKSQFYYKSK